MFFSNSYLTRKMVFIWLLLLSTTVLSNELLQHSSDSQRQKAAQQVTQQFLKRLGGHLRNEMKNHGPVAAIKVCKELAPAIASELSLENGWRVTRVTSKPRNALTGFPDSWEQKTLAEFQALADSGEKYSTMAKTEVVEESGRSYFRFMKPLAIKPVCLSCHGSDEQIPAEVRAELEKNYPFDQATDYKPGELRGAVSIKQPMDIPLNKKFLND
ncbi:MAG TPA: DUF3365 domain-containing protein [Gammaproteobacteria bacterium]|nr:DUF3365 domain-containing protein [Gammaproteobacteria bacterium]